jgi:threonine/homoserine/homoserine lactone efflux protein
MSISSLLLFAGVYLAATASPGPGIAALVARVLARGLGGIAWFVAGYVVGDLVWLSLAASGLEVLAHQFAGLFVAIKYCGVAYLCFLAIAMWRAPAGPAPAGSIGGPPRGWRLFLGSFTLTLGNPKVIVFFLSIMPLVVDLSALSAAVFVEIAALCASILTGVLFGYALAANRARSLFDSARAMRLINRGAASVMAGAALAVATR